MLIAVYDELGVYKQAIGVFRTKVMIGFATIFQYTAIAEFILVVQVYFRSPQCTQLVHKGIASSTGIFELDGSIYGPTFDP